MDRTRALILAGVALLGAATPAWASVDEARAKGLAWLVKNQRGDGAFAGNKGLAAQATAAAVEAMHQGGLGKSPQQARALTWLSNARIDSTDGQAWRVMSLALAGRDASAAAAALRDARNTFVTRSGSISSGNTAVWGAYAGHGASVSDTALGYGALRSASLTYPNDTQELTVTVLCHILPAQLTTSPWNGAWPQALPQTGQPASVTPGSLAATALMLHELKRQRQAGRFLSGSACGRSSPAAVDTAMNSAKAWLLNQVAAGGGFAERNPQSGALEAPNPTLTALAIRALAPFAAEGDSAANSAVSNARAWLVGQQRADGSWAGDPFVTARVLAALPPASGAQLTDSDGDGLTDVVEVKLGTQQTLFADGQGTLNPNANAIQGITATAFAANATLGQPFSYDLNFVAGGGGHSYTLARGALPPGLTLSAGGTITGVPTAAGSYAFDYRAVRGGVEHLLIGRIDVASAAVTGGGDGEVPLPAWALALLGAGLIATMLRCRA